MLKILTAGLILSTLTMGAIGAIAAPSKPAMMGKTAKGTDLGRCQGHDPLFLRQGWCWQVQLQRQVCCRVATAQGWRECQGEWQLDYCQSR